MCLLSIITVVLNDRENFISTRRNLAGQNTQDFEWIVVDGGSTDGTQEAVRESSHPKLRYLSEHDSGIFDAMNKGIALARGEYLLFLNAGDRLASNSTLADLSKILREPGRAIDFLYGDALEESETGVVTLKPARSHRTLWYGMFTHHQAMVYRCSLASDQMYDPGFRIAGDYDFTVRVLRRACEIRRCDFPLCVFKKGGVSERRQGLGRMENFRIQTERLHLNFLVAIGIRLLYLVAAGVRATAPRVYSLVRHRSARKFQ